jgi:hypothetical protein
MAACTSTLTMSPILKRIIINPKGSLPNIKPIIYNLSTYTSKINAYTVVYISGANFFPFGTTNVTFGPLRNIPVTYYSSYNISFTLPQTTRNPLSAGTYSVQVTSVNDMTNIFPSTVYSNKVLYTLTS